MGLLSFARMQMLQRPQALGMVLTVPEQKKSLLFMPIFQIPVAKLDLDGRKRVSQQ